MELSSELEANLRELAAAGPVELRENGARVAPLSSLSWEVRGTGSRPLPHLWSAQHNLTRRVLAITDQSEERLALAVERFGRSRPDRLEFVRVSFERSARELDRDDFCRWIAALCSKEFPDDAVDYFSIHQDLEHSLSGNYPRGVVRSGSARWAAPPLVYFVAPALRFHPATDCLLRMLHPQLEVVRVGLAEHWRRGLSVVLRQ